MLVSFGFHRQWKTWVMECISRVTYSLQINGHKVEFINPTKGLRQGDPLSPYLFLFCVKGLSYKIKSSSLPGISISRIGPSISHLFFADASILYTRASYEEAEIIKRILHEYSLTSGHKINLSKSSLGFNSNTPRSICLSISKILHIDNITGLHKFLSIPANFTRSKRQNFTYI